MVLFPYFLFMLFVCEVQGPSLEAFQDTQQTNEEGRKDLCHQIPFFFFLVIQPKHSE